MGVCWALLSAGQYDRGKQEARRMHELIPGLHEAIHVLIHLYEYLGEFEEAARMIGHQSSGTTRADADTLLAAYAEGGAEGYWRARLRLLDQRIGVTAPVVHYEYAVIHLHLGEVEAALDRLEQIVDSHAPAAVFLPSDQWFTRLREHPRFAALVERIGAPPLPGR